MHYLKTFSYVISAALCSSFTIFAVDLWNISTLYNLNPVQLSLGATRTKLTIATNRKWFTMTIATYHWKKQTKKRNDSAIARTLAEFLIPLTNVTAIKRPMCHPSQWPRAILFCIFFIMFLLSWHFVPVIRYQRRLVPSSWVRGRELVPLSAASELSKIPPN